MYFDTCIIQRITKKMTLQVYFIILSGLFLDDVKRVNADGNRA